MPHAKLATLAALTALMFAAACETMEGLGRDIEKGGDNLEQHAQDAE